MTDVILSWHGVFYYHYKNLNRFTVNSRKNKENYYGFEEETAIITIGLFEEDGLHTHTYSLTNYDVEIIQKEDL